MKLKRFEELFYIPKIYTRESLVDGIIQYKSFLDITHPFHEKCSKLILDFIEQPCNHEYMTTILTLCGVFHLHLKPLKMLACTSNFEILSDLQRKILVSILIDNTFDIPAGYWVQLAHRNPSQFGVLAISALLSMSEFELVKPIFKILPNDEGTADSLWVVLDQMKYRGTSIEGCNPLIVEVLNEFEKE